MAWQQTDPIMNQKIQFAFRAKNRTNFSELCREYGISTKTGYKWKARFEAKGLEGLKEESRRPKSSPEALSEEVVCRLVRIKESHRHWGARKLQIVYERSWGKAPSESSIVLALNPKARVHETQQLVIDLKEVLSTGLFQMDEAAASEGWLDSLAGHTPEREEYGISHFVYRARRPFHPERFHAWIRDHWDELCYLIACPGLVDRAASDRRFRGRRW